MNKLIKQAFTLIELLVVIAIIGILSGLIVVSMSGVTQKANIAKAQVFSNSLRNALMLNLVSEWRLEGNANDTWGTNNGTLNGTTAVSSCVYGACRDFNGTNTDYITLGSLSSIISLQSGSVSLWFKADDIINEKPMFGVDGTGYVILEIRSTKVRIDAGSLGGGVSGSTTLKTGTWYNAVYSSNGTNWKLYVNGNLETLSIGGTDGLWFGDVASGYCDIAKFETALYFDGSLDDIRLFNTSIPISQIKEQYYFGLNNLLASGQISNKEYSERINSIAQQ
jgi:prepilin-type N-terminal cleavage/methylation domain-containing protein